ncbi:MAG TPA: hypothetical protein V6D17_13340 [Candidatus Obscuribacterales bacterium]
MKTSKKLRLCLPSGGLEEDWVSLYQASFPAEERVDPAVLRKDIADGKRLLHRTLDSAGSLLCFSLTFVGLEEFVWLSYIATDPLQQSRGIGTMHMKELLSMLAARYSDRQGLLFEIESTNVEHANNRRLQFYLRLNAKRMPQGVSYLMPSFVDGGEPIAAELLWIEFGHSTVELRTVQSAIAEVYEKIYHLGPNNKVVQTVLSQFAPCSV